MVLAVIGPVAATQGVSVTHKTPRGAVGAVTVDDGGAAGAAPDSAGAASHAKVGSLPYHTLAERVKATVN